MDEFDESPTAVDVEVIVDDKQTGKHRGLDYLGGRETGFTEGVEAVLAATREEFRVILPTMSEREINMILARLRKRAEENG